MDDAEPVPIVEVHSGNFHEMWPSLLLAIKSASFVAMDTELSGLGVRSKLNAKNIDDRYAIICELARTHSVISLGLSCFKLQASTPSVGHSNTDDCIQIGDDGIQPGDNCIQPSDDGIQPGDAATAAVGKNRQSKYLVQTFNIPLLCTESYVVDPAALKFLIAHNFDFNAQYSRGLPYHRGNDVDEDKKLHAKSMRRLFHELLRNDVPIVFHNALIDLVFVYQCFYCDLPPTLASFPADLSEAFTGGIYDTKYISEFKARWPASYLEYVFRKSERENASSAVQESSHFLLTFPCYEGITRDVTYQRSIQVDSLDTDRQEVAEPCRAFSAHGWCSAGEACPKSHDLGVILDSEGKATEKKRRKRARHNRKGMTAGDDVDTSVDSTDNGCVNGNGMCVDGAKSTIRTGSHSAGYDAFMTGFAFAYYVGKYAECRSESETVSFSDVHCSNMTNKICLTGKDIPLQVVKSSFAKTSKNHRDKLEWLKLANG